MLHRIRIENFKCIREQLFSMAPLTILTGENSSGKSTLIQALLMVRASRDKYKFVNPDEVFPQKIGAISQLISQDFQGNRQITISVVLDEEERTFQYRLAGESNQRLEIIGDRWQSGVFPTIQYLNAERIGPRLYTGFGDSERLLCPDGSNAAYLLNQAEQEGLLIPAALRNEDEPQKLTYQVEKYLSAIVGRLELNYDIDLDSAFIRTMMRTSATNKPVTEPLTGFGFSYAFPVVVAGLLCTCSPNTILIVENPEAHLHPSAQSNMGRFLALIASCGVQVIVETHSEHIIDGARLQMADNHMAEQMIIHFFSNRDSGLEIRQIEVNSAGELSAWPKGFFDQKQQDLRELLRMRRG